MQNIPRGTFAAIGFAAGVWVMFFFMRGAILQEFGANGLVGGDAKFLPLRNALLDSMIVVGFLAVTLTLLLCAVVLAHNARAASTKKKHK